MTTKQSSGWAIGWTAFAGTMMILAGGWWIISGLVALINEEFFVVTQEYIFMFDVTIWGWVHLFTGFLVLFAGFGLFSGKVWARSVGVIIAVIAGLLSFAWLPYYPIWAILNTVVSMLIIWALTAHGRDIIEV